MRWNSRTPNLVSVIIPCYNHAHFLGDAIESVLRQSYPEFEIIVIDDGSTDDSSKVAIRYPRVRCIRQENRGLSASRNRGLEESQGEYLVFLDSDDRLLPQALEIGLTTLRDRPECVFVYGRSCHINFEGQRIPVGYASPVLQDHYLALLVSNHIWMPAQVMYRAAIFSEVGGFDPKISAAADYDLYLRIARKFPIYNHNEVVAEYRQHVNNMSRKYGLMLQTTITALRSQRRFIRGDRRCRQAYVKGVRFWQDYYGEGCVDDFRTHIRMQGGWPLARKDALTLLRYYPRGVAKHLMKKANVTLRRALGLRVPLSVEKQVEE